MSSTLLPLDDNDNPIPALRYLEGGAHKAEGAAAATALIALDEDTELLSIKTTGEITVAFGDENVVADADDHGFLAGETDVIPVSDPFTGEQEYSHISIYFVDAGKVYVSERG